MKYFIGNWKMFGVPNSINILKTINSFVKSDKNRNKYKVIITPPFTLLQTFSKYFRNKKINIGAQNCFYKDLFSSNTGAVSPYMIKSLGVQYVIIGHSDNRAEGDDNKLLKIKINFALKNNLKVIFCIGENKSQKLKKQTFSILNKQISSVFEKNLDPRKVILAYEPIWSIGTGLIPTTSELFKTTIFIKKVLKKFFKSNYITPVLYGGSVDNKNIDKFINLKIIDGFLIGGASKSSKKFIDIIKNYYR